MFFWFCLTYFLPVVQTLAHNSTATLSVIKDYLINKLQRESLQIEDDDRKIRQYREETAHLRSEIQELKSRCVSFRNTWDLIMKSVQRRNWPDFALTALRSSRRPSAACATAHLSSLQCTSCVVTRFTSTASRAMLKARPSVPLARQRTERSWTCYELRTKKGTCTIILIDRYHRFLWDHWRFGFLLVPLCEHW